MSSRSGEKGRAQRQPRAEPRRLQGDLLLRARSLLDRPVRRRYQDRRGHAQDHRHRDQRPHREPAVHRIRRGLGPTGKKFVFPGIARGQAVLTIVDVERGTKERKSRRRGRTKCTIPPGRRTAIRSRFLRLVGGFNDLFVYDLDVQPAAAPDHRPVRRARSGLVARRQALAFSTDRFTTDLQTPGRGRPPARGARPRVGRRPSGRRLRAREEHRPAVERRRPVALLRVRSRRHLEHLSHRDRRRDDAADQLADRRQRHHRAEPGAVGRGNRLVFSAFEDNGYTIYALETPEQLAGAPVQTLPINAAVLPPRRDGAGRCSRRSENDTLGLPPETAAIAAEEYKPKLGLDYAGSAGDRRRQGSVRHLRRRRRVVRVQRHARQPHALYRRAGHQPLRRVRRHARLHQPQAPLELGRLGRSDAVRLAHVHARRHRAGAAGLRRGRVPILQIDRSRLGV